VKRETHAAAFEVSVVLGVSKPIKIALFIDDGSKEGSWFSNVTMDVATAQRLVDRLLDAIRAAGGAE